MDCEWIRKIRNQDNIFARQLGIVTTELSPGFARGEMVIRNEYRNLVHSVHDACVFTMADALGGSACASYGTHVTTVNGNLNYTVAMIDTGKLTGTAEVVAVTDKVMTTEIRLSDDTGRLVAIGLFEYCKLKTKY